MWLAPLLVFTVTLLMWEGLVQLFKPPVFLLPAPSLIWQSFSGQFGQLLSYGFNTFLEALSGFVLGCGAGLLAATVVARSPRLSDLLLPFAVASNAVPIVAMAPIAIAVSYTHLDVYKRQAQASTDPDRAAEAGA